VTARIGLLGYAQETNALAPPVRARDGFRPDRQPGGLGADWQAGPAVEMLEQSGAEIVELPVMELPPGGPVDNGDFVHYLAETEAALREAGALDALLVLGHGAGTTTDGTDADGAYLELLRRVIGPQPPIAAVLDLHANVSVAMVRSVDAIVGYRTNPHVDVADRAREAAALTLKAANGEEFEVAWCSLPLLISQLGQLTTGSEPLGSVIDRSQEMVRDPIRNISVFGGFSLGDSSDAGLSVTVTATTGCAGTGSDPSRVAQEVATLAWARRHEYRSSATPLAKAVERACTDSGPLLLADVADNPGGGAPGNSTAILSALVAAGATDVQLGLQCDPDLVKEAFDAGIGADITATFNRNSGRPLAKPFTTPATVTALQTAPYRPTVGVYAGAVVEPGDSCSLDLGGVRVGVSSRPVQVSDPGLLDHVGLDPLSSRVVVVKSRGHFRAGFAHLFKDFQIVEVDASGYAPVDLARLRPIRLRRPIYPIDQELDGLSQRELSLLVRTAWGGRRHR